MEKPQRGPASAYLGALGDKNELLETIRASPEENRVDLYLQPIVSLPQRKLRYYEALSRLRAPRMAMSSCRPSISRWPRQAGLMSVVDNLLAVPLRADRAPPDPKSRDIGIFCNISGDTLADAEFFPQFLGLHAGQSRPGQPDHFRIQPGRRAEGRHRRREEPDLAGHDGLCPLAWTMSKP